MNLLTASVPRFPHSIVTDDTVFAPGLAWMTVTRVRTDKDFEKYQSFKLFQYF